MVEENVDKKVLVDLEVSLPLDKFKQIKELADSLEKTVPETIELCLYERCEDLLSQFQEMEKEAPAD